MPQSERQLSTAQKDVLQQHATPLITTRDLCLNSRYFTFCVEGAARKLSFCLRFQANETELLAAWTLHMLAVANVLNKQTTFHASSSRWTIGDAHNLLLRAFFENFQTRVVASARGITYKIGKFLKQPNHFPLLRRVVLCQSCQRASNGLFSF